MSNVITKCSARDAYAGLGIAFCIFSDWNKYKDKNYTVDDILEEVAKLSENDYQYFATLEYINTFKKIVIDEE